MKKLWREHIKTDVNDWCEGGDLRNCEEFEITYMGKGKGKGKRNRDDLLKRCERVVGVLLRNCSVI